MKLNIQFCGAAQTVTGSCYWVRTAASSFLVDCGMFQGTKTVKQLNYEPFPFMPEQIDFVLLTHAHIDHSGLLPKLYNAGFEGPVYMTAGTKDLLSFMLPDSGYIQEMEVKFLNQRNARHGRESVLPIFTQKEAIACQQQFQTIDYETWFEAGPGIRARYWNAGHILGSASIELEINSENQQKQTPIRLMFSGDIGPDNKLFHPDPEAPSDFDYAICESTYGGIQRQALSPDERRAVLAHHVNDTLNNDGMLVVPAFAVERTQELLVDLSILQHRQQIPQSPIFLDSPMAIRATRVFQDHADNLEDVNGPQRLLDNPNFHFTQTVGESKAINRIHSGAILVAASGMCDAGRIRHHLKHRLWRTNTTILIIGYQEKGTLGHLLLDGKKTVKIQGDDVKVNARIEQIDVYSGHADGNELVEWILSRGPLKYGLFLTHGENHRAQALRKSLLEAGFTGCDIIIPTLDDKVELHRAEKGPIFKKTSPRVQSKSLSGLDWHNDLAQFQIDLRAEFERAADDRSRQILLRRLRRALNNEA